LSDSSTLGLENRPCSAGNTVCKKGGTCAGGQLSAQRAKEKALDNSVQEGGTCGRSGVGCVRARRTREGKRARRFALFGFCSVKRDRNTKSTNVMFGGLVAENFSLYVLREKKDPNDREKRTEKIGKKGAQRVKPGRPPYTRTPKNPMSSSLPEVRAKRKKATSENKTV
jgi:hypothetical protein